MADLLERIRRAGRPPFESMGPVQARETYAQAAEVLGEGLSDRARALLGVALDFACWRTLASGASPAGASALMTSAIEGLERER